MPEENLEGLSEVAQQRVDRHKKVKELLAGQGKTLEENPYKIAAATAEHNAQTTQQADKIWSTKIPSSENTSKQTTSTVPKEKVA